MKKILFSMFGRRRTQLGIVKKEEERKQNPFKMIRINPFFLCQRSYHFRRNLSDISSLFPFKSSYVFPHPFETSKNGLIPFLRNTYKIRHYKKDDGNPTVNYLI
ncbi:hypothetical protein AMTRI_Chr12g237440 [Amborella trichopoda]